MHLNESEKIYKSKYYKQIALQIALQYLVHCLVCRLGLCCADIIAILWKSTFTIANVGCAGSLLEYV